MPLRRVASPARVNTEVYDGGSTWLHAESLHSDAATGKKRDNVAFQKSIYHGNTWSVYVGAGF